MDPPPSTTALHHHYQDSLETSSVSSPTCRQWDDTLPPPKLRMMCSYGGHIIPRPHDKSLCYMGGETRIVVADRHTSLADLCSRLSGSLLHGRQFSLKYQLPSEDLDSLVSVTTDEDLDNMVEEYDRLNSSNPSSRPLRLRLFLFLSRPETAASMGSLLDDAKSETWFVDALNGAGLLPRGLSDSAVIDNLLEPKDGEIQEDRENYTESKMVKGLVHDVLQSSLPDSPMMESTSSFGSSSSSPSMANLPPIKVRVDHMNQMAGLDEQLSQLNVNHVPPPQLPVNNVGGWAASDDERSDQGAPTNGLRKPPLPLQPVQRKFGGHDAYSLPSPDSKHGGAYALHSPDSIASDSSIASANCHSKPTFAQDPNPSSNRDTATPPAATQMYTTTTAMNYQIPTQQIPAFGDIRPPPPQLNQDQQQQFYHIQPHYIHQPPTNQPSPVSSYYPVYATPPPPQMDHQQYPLYYLPVSQNHPYSMQMQSNPPDTTANPTTVTSSATTPPLYPTKATIPLNKSDVVTNSLYGTTNPGMIQVPNNQFQQQYVNLSQIPQSHHPPTPMPITSNGGNYGYEYAHPTQDQVYYSPSQYQTMTPASAMLLAQASSAQQPAPESGK
ncbi:extensin-3-like [Cynara cardunculus var. scolymus]|uniref:Phox/Bem1p n=1 Tax=Cynara cardunculus var. scolymus TaxID=59895 RepID=A0A103Y8F2_CYNCS|nr:extensin-3-like [Cynara cardunculus var. scolymus]KVI04432.1 Phox/Bem1p [Cynara cardunculus var. scolymus]